MIPIEEEFILDDGSILNMKFQEGVINFTITLFNDEIFSFKMTLKEARLLNNVLGDIIEEAEQLT